MVWSEILILSANIMESLIFSDRESTEWVKNLDKCLGIIQACYNEFELLTDELYS